jgi:hypothetical protein
MFIPFPPVEPRGPAVDPYWGADLCGRVSANVGAHAKHMGGVRRAGGPRIRGVGARLPRVRTGQKVCYVCRIAYWVSLARVR